MHGSKVEWQDQGAIIFAGPLLSIGNAQGVVSRGGDMEQMQTNASARRGRTVRGVPELSRGGAANTARLLFNINSKSTGGFMRMKKPLAG